MATCLTGYGRGGFGCSILPVPQSCCTHCHADSFKAGLGGVRLPLFVVGSPVWARLQVRGEVTGRCYCSLSKWFPLDQLCLFN